MTNPIHNFDQALDFELRDGRLFGKTHPAYANMIGPFGGITAAAMLKACIVHQEAQGDPITLTVNFAAAVQNGEFELVAIPTRTGRSTQHWSVQMVQGDEVVTTATAVFATRQETWQATDLEFPQFPADAEPFSREMMPPWAQNYMFRMPGEMRDLIGKAQPNAETLNTIQDNPPRPIDFPSLTAMADVFPPRILIRRAQFAPMGTVAFTIYFHVDTAALAAHGDKEVLGHARANRYYNRYFDQSAEIWSLDGTLMATTTQIVYFKE